MRMPNEKDDKLIQTLKLGLNPLIRSKFEQKLYSQTQKSENAEACFSLALFQCMLIPHISDGQKQHKYLMDTMEWSSRTVEKEKDHWLALFLRSMVRTMMSDEADEMTMYLLPIDYTEEDAINDINYMIDMQKKLEPSEYSSVPYIQKSYVKILENDIEGAIHILNEASKYIKFDKIPHFADILRLPFINIYKKAYELKNVELLRIIKQWIIIFFPTVNFKIKGEK